MAPLHFRGCACVRAASEWHFMARPAAVAATGEMVTPADLRFLCAAFDGAAAASIYACTEHMMLGISNPGADTMTLLDDNLIFEFHADHSIITNLFNFTMPLGHSLE
jgi:phenylacetate-CoA ligase